MAGALNHYGEVGTGSTGNALPNPPPNNEPKPRRNKKEVGLKKQCGQKIQAISSKLTELMVLHSKVSTSPLQHS